MPLESGTTRAVIDRNTNELIDSGFPPKQAYAIAMKKAGKYRPKTKRNPPRPNSRRAIVIILNRDGGSELSRYLRDISSFSRELQSTLRSMDIPSSISSVSQSMPLLTTPGEYGNTLLSLARRESR